jgi:hypothetical protein
MSYECTVWYYDKKGDYCETTLLADDQDEEAVEAALAEYDSEAKISDFEWKEYGCTLTYLSCGATVTTTYTVYERSEEAVEKMHSESGGGEILEWEWNDDAEAREEKEAAEAAKMIRVEWDDKDDVLDLFHRCVATLSRDFDISLKKLKKELKENFVKG